MEYILNGKKYIRSYFIWLDLNIFLYLENVNLKNNIKSIH
jgi:hypothetical protein